MHFYCHCCRICIYLWVIAAMWTLCNSSCCCKCFINYTFVDISCSILIVTAMTLASLPISANHNLPNFSCFLLPLMIKTRWTDQQIEVWGILWIALRSILWCNCVLWIFAFSPLKRFIFDYTVCYADPDTFWHLSFSVSNKSNPVTVIFYVEILVIYM